MINWAYQPLCRNMREHAAHYDHLQDRHCEGVTAEQGDTYDLVMLASRVAASLHRLDRSDRQTARLVCHPSVLNALHKYLIPDLRASVTDPPALPVEVVVNSGMHRGEWDLILAHGEVRA